MAREVGMAAGTCAACGRQAMLLERDRVAFRGRDRPLCTACADEAAMWFAGLADIVERRSRT